MMWLAIEIIAIIVECFLAINFNVGYFRMKNNNYTSLKILGGTLVLSLWDYLGTLLVKNEFLAMSGFAIILLKFYTLFLKSLF